VVLAIANEPLTVVPAMLVDAPDICTVRPAPIASGPEIADMTLSTPAPPHTATLDELDRYPMLPAP
jgi:hypothetical protein